MRTHPEADACRIKVIRIRVGPHEGVPQYEGAASQSETGMRIREIERIYDVIDGLDMTNQDYMNINLLST